MLVELLHKVAQMEDEDREPVEYYPRPSMAGPDRCIRQMVYLARGEEKEKALDGRVLHIFNDGHWHEELTIEWIQKTAFTLHSQQMRIRVSMQGLTIGGSIDGVLTDILGRDRLFEHKGYNHFTFQKYAAKEIYPEDNFTQCAIYLRGLQDVNPDIREALLIIKNKNTCAFLEYLLDYERETDTLTVVSKADHLGEVVPIHTPDHPEVRPSIVTDAFWKFLEVEQHKTSGSLPDRPYGFDDWHCEYCAFQGACWSGFGEEVEALAPETELEGEVADTLRYYREVSAHLNEGKREQQALRAQIIAMLREKKAKKGKAGEYVATLSVYPAQELDQTTLPARLQQELAYHKTQTWKERLTITNLNEKKSKTKWSPA